VIIQQLHIRVSSADRSYMPQQVVISAGCDVNDLHEVKDVHIPRCVDLDRRRSTCVSRQLQLRTGGFCWCKVLLSATGAFGLGEDAGVLLSTICLRK